MRLQKNMDKEQEYQEVAPCYIDAWRPKTREELHESSQVSIKLRFFYKKKIRVSFRYKNKQEYFFTGKIKEFFICKKECISGIEEFDAFGGDFTMKISSGDLCVFNFDDIDYLSIHPASYNPIRYFERKSISEELREKVFKRDNNKCQLRLDGCTKVAEEVDHIIPVSKGGLNNIENLQSSCMNCNRKKSNKLF